MSQMQRTDDGFVGVRGARYGEILLARLEGSVAVADVYTTFTLNECPDDLWQAIEPGKVAADHGCDFALKNGPRYWLMDSIRRGPGGEFELAEFGGIPMARIASVRVDLGAQSSPGRAGGPLAYHPVRVDRKALFTFDSGRTVYELVDPAGAAFVMQAYCIAADPTLSEQSLGSLGDRLALPDGWSFVARSLDAALAVDTRTEDAVVVQDEWQNSYCQYR